MKETKIEKLILDLSTRWEVSPEEAVDRLNSMNESEINKLINSMTKKFQGGGKTEEVKTIFGDGSPIRAWVSKGFFSGNPTIRLQKYTPRQKFIGVEYADNDAGFLERTIDGNDTTYVGHGAVPLMLVGEQKVKTTSKNQNDPMLPKLRKAFNVLGYKNGGFIDCLRNGGSISKCKCGCDKIIKGDEGIPGLRQRGTTPAYLGTQPKFDPSDSTWVRTKDGYMKNVFSGNTLEQNLVTYDENGIPRRSIREITDYMFPMDADTLYRDARGLWASKHPSIIDELFNKTHSNEYIKTVDENLEGFEPIQFNEKEVKATQKKSKKEMGGKIQKGQNGLYDLGFSFKPIGFRNNFSVPRLTLSNDALGLSSMSTQDMLGKANALQRDAAIAKTIDLNNKIDNHLRKNERLKNIKPWYDQSSFIGSVTNPVDVLNAGPQELMSDKEMSRNRDLWKKTNDFIKSVKPMPIESDINTQIANAKNFSQAFGLARKAGLKEFDWKGERIAVKLDSDSPETTTPAVETPVTTQPTQPVVQPTQPTITPAPKKSTEDLWRDILHTGGAGLYPYQAPVPDVESDAYLGPTGQWSRPQTGYVYTPVTIEDRIAATGVDPNSPQGRRMAKYQ